MTTFSIQSMQVLPGWTYNAYSYTQSPVGAFMGGWATVADVGPDIIYTYADGVLSPIQWTTDPGPYHLNDPSLIQPTGPSQANWTYLYATALDNRWTTFEEITTHNELFFASSVAGSPWTPHGVILTDTWAPSAIQAGGDIVLFSHDHYGRAQAAHLDQNGWSVLQANQLMVDANTGGSFTALNLHVSAEGDHFRMVANSGTLHDIISYTSQDLIHWTPDGVLVHSDDHMLLTPELHNGMLTFSQDGNWTMAWGVTFA